MKITRITPLVCDGGWRALTFVKVETDEGITGYAECADTRTTFGIVGSIRDIEPLLIGKNPLEVEKRNAEMNIFLQQNPGGVGGKAIASIEIALWDIKAKYHNVPLYALFGGPLREKIRVYWSHFVTWRAWNFTGYSHYPPVKTLDDVYNLGKEALEHGYTAAKTNIFIPGTPGRGIRGLEQTVDNATLKGIVDQLSAIRRAVGDNFDIMIDFNFNFKTEGYIQVGRAIEQFNPFWMELDIYDPEALARIKEFTRVPICANECLHGMKEFNHYLKLHSADVCMIDLLENGYIESRKVVALADMYETMVTPHNYYSHLSTFMNAHFAAVIPNLKIMETDFEHVPWEEDIITDFPSIKGGYLSLPTKPGLGADLNEKGIAKHPWPK